MQWYQCILYSTITCLLFGCKSSNNDANGADIPSSNPSVNNAAVRAGQLTPGFKSEDKHFVAANKLQSDGNASLPGLLGPIEPTISDLPIVQSVVIKSATSSDSYTVRALIGAGSAGKVYWVNRVSDNASFAMKEVRANDATRNEISAYTLLNNRSGFSQLIDSWQTQDTIYIILKRLGNRIEDIRTLGGGKLAVMADATVGSIALQLIDRIQTIHSLGIVHGDLFPNNLAVGLGGEFETLYVFDFGESNAYIDQDTKEVLRDIRKTRQFDIQSLSHTVLQLLKPGTPYGDYKHWADDASKPSLDVLCQGLPAGVRSLFGYSHEELDLHDAPDYGRIRSYMSELAPSYNGKIFW